MSSGKQGYADDSPAMIARSKMRAALAAAVLIGAGTLGTSAVLAQEVTIASWGGAYQKAQSEALFKPVSEALGIKVIEETYGGIGDVRLKVKDKGLWTAVLAVIGAGVMLFNWVVINFVITGLHSYA